MIRIIGTADQCVAKIKWLREQGFQYLRCNFVGGMKHKKVLKAIELFPKEVVPRFGLHLARQAPGPDRILTANHHS